MGLLVYCHCVRLLLNPAEALSALSLALWSSLLFFLMSFSASYFSLHLSLRAAILSSLVLAFSFSFSLASFFLFLSLCLCFFSLSCSFVLVLFLLSFFLFFFFFSFLGFCCCFLSFFLLSSSFCLDFFWAATSASHSLELAAKEATRSSHCPSIPGLQPHTMFEFEP